MKKTIRAISMAVIAMAFCVAHNSLSAQEVARRTPVFGIKGGVNLTNLYTDNVTNENLKVGLNAGVYAKLPVSNMVSIQPEVLYSMKGAQNTYNNVFGSGKYRFNLDYIEVPVGVVVNVAKNFNINAGPYVAFLLNAKVKDVDANGNINGITQLNTSAFNTVDAGLFGGVGFDVGGVTLGARYTHGLADVGKSGGPASNYTQNSKNSGFTFFVGFGL